LDPREFCSQARLVIVAGKGGVGKTTVSAALARLASRAGLSVLLMEMEGKSGLAAAFGADDLEYDEQLLRAAAGGEGGEGEIRARTLTPDRALLEYLDDHGLRRISKRLSRSGALDVVATAAPGIKDILLLGKVKQIERRQEADLVILDAPAAGHALTFLLAPRTLLETVSAGPIRVQAEEVLELLADPARCQVLLVTLPEETPVNEVVEAAFALEDRVGVDLGPVVVNGLYPVRAGLDADPDEAARAAGVTLAAGEAEALRAAAAFRLSRQRLQQEQAARLAEALPLAQLHLPILFTAGIGPAQVDDLAEALAAGVAALEPASDPIWCANRAGNSAIRAPDRRGSGA
jgi:anion-transporting  ArsA/GET3 family ATPase